VVRSGDTSATVSVDYTTTGGIATPGADYIAQSETMSFVAGETNKTFSIPILTRNDNKQKTKLR